MSQSIRDAIIKVVSSAKENSIYLQAIYDGVCREYNVTEYQNQPDPKYGRRRIEHEIRSIIAKLVSERVIERSARGWYRIKTGQTA